MYIHPKSFEIVFDSNGEIQSCNETYRIRLTTGDCHVIPLIDADEKIVLYIGEKIIFSPTLFEARIGNTDILIKNDCLFWMCGNEFGFAYSGENKLPELIKDYFLVKKDKIKIRDCILATVEKHTLV